MAARKGLDTTMELTRHALALREQGYDFVLRYYSTNATKNLSLGEARALAQAGLQIGVVWETTGTYANYFTIGQPYGSAIYFAVDYDPTQADLDGAISNYFTGVHAALYVGAEGKPSYRVGVYGSGLCCATLVERGICSLSWLSQSTAFTGSKQYAEQWRYSLIQMLPARILGGDGVVLSIDPDATRPEHEAGLFSV